MLTERHLFYGTDNPPSEGTLLRAGPLTVRYDSGDLRYIRLGERELVRRVYVALRDPNWATIPMELDDIQGEAEDDHFHITYTAAHRGDDGRVIFTWTGTITGTADGQIIFHMEGEAIAPFQRNRLGFCILQPMSLAGEPLTVEHPDGKTQTSVFPKLVEPHQPFINIQAMRYPAGGGATAELRFAGDVFEIEDQRNWGDASYKTYCTPLDLPMPVQLNVGDTVNQSVTFSLLGDVPDVDKPDEDSRIQLVIGTEAAPLPPIGFGVAHHGQPLTDTEAERLRALRPAHLRVDVRSGSISTDIAAAAQQAAALDAGLEVAVHLGDHPADDLDALRAALEQTDRPVVAVLVFKVGEHSTGADWLRLARQHLPGETPIFGGTDAYFTALNRDHTDMRAADGVVYSMNPQVHAFSNTDLTETPASAEPVLATAYKISEGKPVRVGPITLKMRWNPDASGPAPAPAADELPPQVDPRQMSLYGAGWTALSVQHHALGGAAALTYYETTGMRGLMATADGPPSPELFPAPAGSVYPMYHVFADLAAFAEGEVVRVTSSRPLAIGGMVLRKAGATRLLLVNHTSEPHSVTVEGLAGPVTVRSLDASNAESAMRAPVEYRQAPGETLPGPELRLTLAPYAVVRVDSKSA